MDSEHHSDVITTLRNQSTTTNTKTVLTQEKISVITSQADEIMEDQQCHVLNKKKPLNNINYSNCVFNNCSFY